MASLTPNALARMLEERPDPTEFRPVLQIAGECVFRFEMRAIHVFFFFFLRSILFFFEKFRGERARNFSPLARALLLFFFLSTDIRKIKNNSGEQETAENTRWRIMIRCDVFINLFFRILGVGKSVHFSNYLSLSFLSSSRNRHPLLEKEKTSLFDSSSLTPPPALSSSSSPFIFT
jgi:hypothetical protein